MIRSLILLLLVLVIYACGGNTDKLIGNWVATSVLQDNKKLDVDLSLIGFEFKDDGTYHFTSTLDYEEAGSFDIDGNKLITIDTIHTRKQKAVLIEKIDSDSLKLRMKNEQGWMQVALVKK